LKKVKRKKGYVFLYRLNRESNIVSEDEKTYMPSSLLSASCPPPSRALNEKYIFELNAQEKRENQRRLTT